MPVSRRVFLGAAAALGFSSRLSAEPRNTRRLVMLAGTPSHGPGDHEHNAGVQLLAKCLAGVPGLETTVVLNGWSAKAEAALDGADALLVYADGGANHPLVRGNRLELIGNKVKAGLGLMCVHYAVEVPADAGGKEFKDWIGGHYEHQFSVNPMWSPEFTTFPDHPISRGVKPFRVRDEWYFNMRFRDDAKGITPILTAVPPDAVRDGPYVYPKGPYPHIQAAKGRAEHMMWAYQRPDGGRGVGFTGGHIHRNWQTPGFRTVVLNALVWISKLEVPEGGVPSTVSDEEIARNLDPKPARK
jgi:hypothetical protein